MQWSFSKERFAATLAALLMLPLPAMAQAEQVVVSGELDVVHVDRFDHQEETAYFLRDDERHTYYRLIFDHAPPGHLKTGHKITVHGRGEGHDLRVEALSETPSNASPNDQTTDAALSLQERRALVLMVDLADAQASTRYTLDQIAANMWTGSRSVDGLYRTASIHQLGFAPDTDGDGTADVFGPFAIPNSKLGCNFYDWASAAEDAATQAGIDLSLYQHRVFVLPRYNDLPDCYWAGVANVGCGTYCRAWIAQGESAMVFAHELGHNLDMGHAATDPENDGVINSSYGDLSDPMGSSRSWHIFNAAHIDQMQWYASFSGSVKTVVASGTYDIAALGLDPTVAGTQILKIKKADTAEFYYLSYRQPLGYDDSLSATYTQGVNIHRYKGTGYGYTYFINSLPDLGSFADTTNGITVTQIGHSGDYATVSISLTNGGGSGGKGGGRKK